jgi:hypothetical protein
MKHPPFADDSLLGTCMQIAYGMSLGSTRSVPSTPARPTRESPPGAAPQRAARGNVLRRALDAADEWFYRQKLAARERYLAQAHDVFEVEARMRELERRPYY